MNFNESNFFSGIDRSIQRKRKDSLFDVSLLTNLKEKFDFKFQNKRPNLNNFKDIYGEKVIQSDVKFTEGAKRQYENQNDSTLNEKKLVAEVFEGIIIDEAENSAWLGRHVRMSPTSTYDDIVNKVDAVAEFEFGKEKISHLGLAIDVTFTKDEDQILRKLNVIEQNIRSGRAPALVKYYESENIRPRSLFIPKVVVGADAKTVRELVELWNQKHSSDERVWKKAKNDLNFHPFQTKLLFQVHEQLSAFERLAKGLGQEKSEKSYQIARKIIEDVISEKTLYGEQKESDEVKNDQVLQTILSYSRYLKR